MFIDECIYFFVNIKYRFVYFFLCYFINIHFFFAKNTGKYIENETVEIIDSKNNFLFSNSIIEHLNIVDKFIFFLKNNIFSFLDFIQLDNSYNTFVNKIINDLNDDIGKIKNNDKFSIGMKEELILNKVYFYKKKIEKLKKNYFRYILFKNIKTKKRLYSKDNVIESNRKIKDYFNNLGFLDNNIKTYVYFYNNKVYINYKIYKGKYYFINSYEILSNNIEIKNILDNILQKKFNSKHEIVNFSKLKLIKDECYSTLLRKGYFNIKKEIIEIYICKNEKDDTVDIVFSINTNKTEILKKYKYENITIDYECDYSILDREKKNILYKISNPIRKNTISKLINIKKGNIYNEDDIEDLYNTLYETDVFKNIDINRIVKNGLLNIQIKLIPVERFSINSAIKVNINKKNMKTILSTGFKMINFFKNMEQFNIQLNVENKNNYKLQDLSDLGNYNFSLSNNITYPFSLIFNKFCKKTDINTILIYTYNNKKNIMNKLTYNIKYKYFNFLVNLVFFDISVNLIKKNKNVFKKITQDISLGFNCKYKNKILSTDINIEYHMSSINRNFNLLYKSLFYKYINNNLNFYLKIHLEQLFLIKISNIFDTKFIIKLGDILYYNKNIPENKLFRLGGEETLKAWNLGEIGPGLTYNKGYGTILFYFSNEYIYKISHDLNIIPFVDLGNIWNKLSENKKNIDETIKFNKNLLKSIYVDAGIGFKFLIGIFNLRSDFSFKIYEPQSIKKDIFSINFRVVNN